MAPRRGVANNRQVAIAIIKGGCDVINNRSRGMIGANEHGKRHGEHWRRVVERFGQCRKAKDNLCAARRHVGAQEGDAPLTRLRGEDGVEFEG